MAVNGGQQRSTAAVNDTGRPPVNSWVRLVAMWHAMSAATSACKSHVSPHGSATSADWVPLPHVAATSAADVAEGIITLQQIQIRDLRLAIRGVLADGDWIVEPSLVKNEFLKHFATRFAVPSSSSITFDYQFPNRLTPDQNEDLERNVSYEEIKRAVWDFGISKSPGPDGSLPPGCNSLFTALIPKSQEAKMVKEFRPISLIGSMYKIITKVLANRLSLVISELKSKALIFKIDFEKAFDSVRWDYLDVVLANFGFGLKWRSWIQGCLNSAMGSILVNGSPTSEFKFSKGLKQGDPLSPFLFILIMESLHLSFNNVVNAGLYNGIQIDESLNLSHLFYADDVIFVGKWNSSNLSTIVNVLKWFYLASGLKINLNKSKLMGIGISHDVVASAAKSIGCSILHTPFNYLGVKVGGIMSRLSSWDDVVAKLSAVLSKWKLNSLSIGGRLNLIKFVLSSLPLYYMSSFKPSYATCQLVIRPAATCTVPHTPIIRWPRVTTVVTGDATGPQVNGGGQRWPIAVNDGGQRWRTTVGPSVDQRSTMAVNGGAPLLATIGPPVNGRVRLLCCMPRQLPRQNVGPMSHVSPRGSATSADWVPLAHVAATSTTDVAEGIITLQQIRTRDLRVETLSDTDVPAMLCIVSII
ncbi:RNA-directed DNA polymerase, eukaryota [Tanacetum coccineum]|uniref:RNA-directed DNA polymerase, eukaryota n=1 Tax=Tanacetum coccineum TaxID=301880 RepID=A0ABQ4ZV96_9ASTR